MSAEEKIKNMANTGLEIRVIEPKTCAVVETVYAETFIDFLVGDPRKERPNEERSRLVQSGRAKGIVNDTVFVRAQAEVLAGMYQALGGLTQARTPDGKRRAVSLADLDYGMIKQLGGKIEPDLVTGRIVCTVSRTAVDHAADRTWQSLLSATEERDPFLRALREGQVDVEGLLQTVEEKTGWPLLETMQKVLGQGQRAQLQEPQVLPPPARPPTVEESIDAIVARPSSQAVSTQTREAPREKSRLVPILASLGVTAGIAICFFGTMSIVNAPTPEGRQAAPVAARSVTMPTVEATVDFSDEAFETLLIPPATPQAPAASSLEPTPAPEPLPVAALETGSASPCQKAFPECTITKGNETLFQTGRNIIAQAKTVEGCAVEQNLGALVNSLVSINRISNRNSVPAGELTVPGCK